MTKQKTGNKVLMHLCWRTNPLEEEAQEEDF